MLIVALTVWLLSFMRTAESDSVRIVDTRGDYVYNTDSDVAELNYVTLANDPKAALPDQFTICSSGFLGTSSNYGEGFIISFNWFQALKEDFTPWFMVHGGSSSLRKQTDELTHTIFVTVNGSTWIKFGDYGPFRYNRWIHMCMGVDLVTGLLSPVVDGTVLPQKVAEGLGQGRPMTLAGRLVIGKHSTDNTWYQNSNLMGNTQIFGRKLSQDELRAITAGAKCGVEGDYLAWRQMKWDVKGPTTVWTSVTKEVMCSRNTAVRFINTAGASHDQAIR